MTTAPEIAANLVYGAAVFLAARNSVHTWWTGILGCLLFAWVYHENQLYAGVTLQGFFILTCAIGWWQWLSGNAGQPLPVRRTGLPALAGLLLLSVLLATGYGALLARFTGAYEPFWDSAVLAFSMLAQFLLMARRIENWPVWLLVNSIAVPLYASRGLTLTAAIYALFWFNAIHGYLHWRREMNAKA